MPRGPAKNPAVGVGARLEKLYMGAGHESERQFAIALMDRYKLDKKLNSLAAEVSKWRTGESNTSGASVPRWIVCAADMFGVSALSLVSEAHAGERKAMPTLRSPAPAMTERDKAAQAAELLGFDAEEISAGLQDPSLREGSPATAYFNAIVERASVHRVADRPRSRTIAKAR